ncbi:hypothetical protein DIS07_02585 [Polaribacter aquimarinus]|uniref:Uncharacterized protein n=1 Tax=Polaribacter aquimarinus TaxID=2100726 RepID=A0A2U2JEF0_9FLAO|nr:T9SS type A sorting domain-containing protein [uncultured Polaribacter sp.]PWG06743.1 hypothetical protein DIS07_02585 [Polaribacter aquimarinus]
MRKNILNYVLLFAFLFLSLFINAQSAAADEDTGTYTTCNPDGENATRTSNDLTPRANVGTIDDRSCYANYKESILYGKTWGIYNITHNSNKQDTNGLQPRIERSLSRSQTTGVGSYAKFTGTLRILEVGKTNNTNNDGTYFMQAKGKHTGEGGSTDPAICLYLAKPVYGPDGNGNQVQVSFNIYREQIKYRGGSGAAGRDVVYLTNIAKDALTTIELKVGFKQDPADSSKKIHYADAIIGGTAFNWEIPEPERGTQSGIRYGAYRVKGGRAQIRWADTTYEKVENASSGVTITSAATGDWNTGSTWVGGNVPTINDDVIVNHVVTVERNGVGAHAKSLTCGASPAQLIVRENTSVTVTGNISLSRSVDAIIFYGQQVNGKIGTITFGGTYTSGRRTQIRKRLTQDKWFLISNPFVTPKVEHTTGHTSTKLRTNGTKLAFASYDDSKVVGSKYTYFDTGATSGQLGFFDSASTLGNAQGYSISVNAADVKDDYVMQGKQHDGSVSYALSTGGNGFNLVGNPYISYLYANDAASIADGTENILKLNGSLGSDLLVEDTIWLWDGDNGVWITKNRGGAKYHINPLQGFFVKAKSTGNFTFNKTMETHASNSDVFLKNSDNRFEIDLSIAKGKKRVSTSIRYMDKMTTDFDNGYDSSIFGGYSSSFEVYTNLVGKDSGKKLAIQSLPNVDYQNMIVPIGVNTDANSQIVFKADALNVPIGYKVYLEDRLNSTFTRLDEVDAYYTATVSEKTTEGRFYLHARTSALSLDLELLNSVRIYKSNISTLKIVGLSQGKTNVSLYNIIGEQVLKTSFHTSGSKEISLPRLPKGVYVVQLETETGKLNKKIVLE